MPGHLFFSDVPHQPQRYPLPEPLLKLSNALVLGLVTPALRTSSVELRGLGSIGAGPHLFLAWHRYNYASVPVLLRMPEELRPVLLMHDGLASRALTHESSTWAGLDAFVYRRRSGVSPREQIVRFLRSSGRGLLVLPDAGGPYRVAKPGMLDIARACSLPLVSVRFHVEGQVSLGEKLDHVIPLPLGHIVADFGTPIPPDEATVERCSQALGVWA